MIENHRTCKVISRRSHSNKFQWEQNIFLSNLSYPSIIRDTIEIATHKNPICNNDTASFNFPKLWVELFHDYEYGNKH